MDPKTKSELLNFLNAGDEQISDLATWIHAPQRRYHRHEFFGLDVARLTSSSGETFLLKDIGYGGCGLAIDEEWAGRNTEGSRRIDATLTVLDCSLPVTVEVKHTQKRHAGCEFVDVSPDLQKFLRGFIQYMDAALLVRQVPAGNVFPAFRGPMWLNVAAHREAIRFSICANPDGPSYRKATLGYVMQGRHIYCAWDDGRVEIGFLDGPPISGDDAKPILRQIITILIGIRQGASLPAFEPVIAQVIALLT